VARKRMLAKDQMAHVFHKRKEMRKHLILKESTPAVSFKLQLRRSKL
jgi:hypothetical protein